MIAGGRALAPAVWRIRAARTQPARRAVDSGGMDTPAIDLATLDPYQAQAVRARYHAVLRRVWLIMAAASGTLLADLLYETLTNPRFARMADWLPLAGLAVACLVAVVAASTHTRRRWPAAVVLAAASPLFIGVARALATAAHVRVGPRDAVLLAALIALMVAPAFTLVTERPVPPWGEELTLDL